MQRSNLNTFNNNWYSPGSNSLVRILWFFINTFFFLNPLNPFSSVKIILLKIFRAKIGTNVIIKPSVNIKYPWRLSIGNNSWIGENSWIDNLADVNIGSNVCISQGSYLLTGNHNYKKLTFDLIIGDINIEDGVWIGAKSIVCPGVNMRSHSILTVGSILTSDTDAYSIYSGNPAKFVRKRIFEENLT